MVSTQSSGAPLVPLIDDIQRVGRQTWAPKQTPSSQTPELSQFQATSNQTSQSTLAADHTQSLPRATLTSTHQNKNPPPLNQLPKPLDRPSWLDRSSTAPPCTTNSSNTTSILPQPPVILINPNLPSPVSHLRFIEVPVVVASPAVSLPAWTPQTRVTTPQVPDLGNF